jgi:hypothetical protein
VEGAELSHDLESQIGLEGASLERLLGASSRHYVDRLHEETAAWAKGHPLNPRE